ncbi:hypothetical protein EDC01DRAFT_610190 [Geopyxis carbonaria]|nr:hypothetical protein EDC01DRAFT_610190 [Geopyxis carbonaria]
MADVITVTDPTDWEPTRIPELGPLDAALRCQICKDFYTSAVITNCCHTFCSLCIRRAIQGKEICPLCRAPVQEHRLLKNTTVQDVVDVFIGTRSTLFEMATVTEIPQRVESPIQNSPQRPKRGRGRPRGSTKKALPIIINDSDEYAEEEDEEEVVVPDDGLVACPLCQQRMKEVEVSPHLDRCLSNPDPTPPARPPLSSAFGRQLRSRYFHGRLSYSSALPTPIPPPILKPLPKLTYSLLKEAKLRDKLRELGIPSHGTKKLMQDRHTEWTNIWNANVDSNRQRSKQELLKNLEIWERAHIKPANNKTKGPEWSDVRWAHKNQDNFSSLVQKAKQNAKRRKVEQESKTEPPIEKDSTPSPQLLDSSHTSQASTQVPPKSPYFATVLSPSSLPQSKSDVIREGLPPPSSFHSDVFEHDEYVPFPSSQRRRSVNDEPIANSEKRKLSSSSYEEHFPFRAK